MKWYVPLAAACVFLSACGGPSGTSGESEAAATPPVEPTGMLNVYSARHYDSDKELYKRFEAETGIQVRFRESGAAELLEAMKAEGDKSPADVIISSDAGTLYRFKAAGLMQPIESDILLDRIPEHFRDPDHNWYGLAKRLRVIVYDPARVEPDQVDEYADLASANFGSLGAQRRGEFRAASAGRRYRPDRGDCRRPVLGRAGEPLLLGAHDARLRCPAQIGREDHAVLPAAG